MEHMLPPIPIISNFRISIIPQQRKLMGSSAQNSSGVHWCRPRVSFNRVPEKVPEKVPERFRRRSGKLGSTGSGSRRRFNRAPEKVPEKVWEALVQGQVKFNRVPEKVPEKVWKALVQSQVKFNRFRRKFRRRSGRGI